MKPAYTHHLTHNKPRGIQLSPDAESDCTDLFDGTTQGIDAWEQCEIDGITDPDRGLPEATQAMLIAEVKEQAQHERDRLLNKDFHIYSGTANPVDGGLTNLDGWQFEIVYGRTMTEDDFHINITGKWEVQAFQSVARDDGCFDVTFNIATKTHRGIIDWAGLVQSIALDGNYQ